MRNRDKTIVCVNCDGSFKEDEQGNIYTVQQQRSGPQAPAPVPAVNRTPAATTPTSGMVPQQLSASQRSSAQHTASPAPAAAVVAPAAPIEMYGLPPDAFARYASGVGSGRMGGKLLTGWAMLGEVCDSPYCSCPIMRSPSGDLVCVNCPDWLPAEQRRTGYSSSVDVPPPTSSQRAEAMHRYGEDNVSYSDDDEDSYSGMLESKHEGSPAAGGRVSAFPAEPTPPPAGSDEEWADAMQAIVQGIAADEASGPSARESAVPAEGISVTSAPSAPPAGAAARLTPAPVAHRSSGAAASAPSGGQRLSGVAVLEAPADWSSMTHEELMAFAAGGNARPARTAAPKPAKQHVPPTRVMQRAAAAPQTAAAIAVPKPVQAPTAPVPAALPALDVPAAAAPAAAAPVVKQALQIEQAIAALQGSIGQASTKLQALSAADSPEAVAALAASIQACAAALTALKDA